jgi:hypothetical protein
MSPTFISRNSFFLDLQAESAAVDGVEQLVQGVLRGVDQVVA